MATKAFQKRFIALSRADTWQEAAVEWRILQFIPESDETQCLCGQWMKDLAILRNARNGKMAHFGPTCATHVLRIANDRILDNLGLGDRERVITLADVVDANADGFIDDESVKFYEDVMKAVRNGTKLLSRRLAWKLSIEQKVLLRGRNYLWSKSPRLAI